MYGNEITWKHWIGCIVGGLAIILLTTNAIGFFGMKKVLNECGYDDYIKKYGTVKYVREFMKNNEPKSTIIKTIRKITVGLGEELAYLTH